jgi:hypothetical protein
LGFSLFGVEVLATKAPRLLRWGLVVVRLLLLIFSGAPTVAALFGGAGGRENGAKF